MNPHPEEKLLAYAEGTLSESETLDVRAHLDRCPRCAEALEETRRVLRALDMDVAETPLSPMWPRLEPHVSRRGGSQWDGPFLAATAAALLIGVTIGILAPERPRATPPRTTATVETDWTAAAAPTLADIYLTDANGNGRDEEGPL